MDDSILNALNKIDSFFYLDANGITKDDMEEFGRHLDQWRKDFCRMQTLLCRPFNRDAAGNLVCMECGVADQSVTEIEIGGVFRGPHHEHCYMEMWHRSRCRD